MANGSRPTVALVAKRNDAQMRVEIRCFVAYIELVKGTGVAHLVEKLGRGRCEGVFFADPGVFMSVDMLRINRLHESLRGKRSARSLRCFDARFSEDWSL